MKPEAQRQAIAEACGWTNIHTCTCGSKQRGTSPDGGHEGRIPDCLSDLNAMHEAEKALSPEGVPSQWDTYEAYLEDATGMTEALPNWKPTWHATAAQRAEAFLHTLGLWTTEP